MQVLLNENYYLTTFGALEYDPEVFNPLNVGYGEGMLSPGSLNDIKKGSLSPSVINNDKANDGRVGSPRSNDRTLGGDYEHQ